MKNLYMPETEKKQRMSLYITPTLKSKLEILAKTQSRTISNMVEVLIADAVKKAESDENLAENFKQPIAA